MRFTRSLKLSLLKMRTIAKDFCKACEAGLDLFGQDCDGNPEWIGTEKEWKKYMFTRDLIPADNNGIYNENICK